MLLIGCGIAMPFPPTESDDAVNYYLHLNTTDGKSICALVSDDLKFGLNDDLFSVSTLDAKFTCVVSDVRDITYAKQINSGVTEILSESDVHAPVVAFHSGVIDITCAGPANTYCIYSMDGRIVMHREFSDYVRIEVSSWECGVYIININNLYSVKIYVK